MTCPLNNNAGSLTNFLRGTYCDKCAEFDEEKFLANWHPVYFLVQSFIQRFNHREFTALGDPVMAMIGTEIWLYNIGRLLEREGIAGVTELLANDERRRDLLPKCNTHSLAQYFALPYQTVRRKVQTLVERGLIEKNAKGELCVTSAGESEFNQERNMETMRDFVGSARCVFAMLGIEQHMLEHKA